MTEVLLGLQWLLVALVLLGALPLLVANYQFLLVAVHFRRLHYARCAPYLPRVAVVIPAWNEAAVIGTSVDRLMRLDYPRDALRIVVVDDASTDATPEVAAAKAAAYPGNVVHLRRERGGEGKAATLNHGLAQVLADDWAQAILIIDADVIYEPASLRWMTRHLADPEVGSVTAYIKEGSRPGNYLTRFIGYEYIVASAAARRGQEAPGAIACLAGGAQLHSRENLEALGGQVDTGTLAEDTVTTFQTQLGGRRAIFEPNAVVWAEDPAAIGALWRQRLRWARGNRQVTRGSPVCGSGRSRQPAGQHQFRPDVVLPAAAPGLPGGRVGLAGHPVLHRQPPGLGGLSRALAGERGHLRVHHLLRPAHRPSDGPGGPGRKRCCSRARSTC